MFAYCNNDPVDCYDADGEGSLWVLLFLDHCFGFIHHCVATDIVNNNLSVSKEYWLQGMRLRADIVSNDGSVWEIKTVYTGPEEASSQAANYIGKTTIRGNVAIQKLGAAHKFTNTFYIYDGEEYYRVYYATPLEGAILYMVSPGQAAPDEGYAVYNYYRKKSCNSANNQSSQGSHDPVPIFIPIPPVSATPGFGGGGGAPWQNVLRPQMA